MKENSIPKDMLELACAKIVHEVKNPLTLIHSTLQLIEIEMPEVTKNKHWSTLYEELGFINSLLSDFNTLSSCTRVQMQSIDLGELVADVCDHFYAMATQKNIKLTLDMPEDILNIQGDEIKLIEIFSNLIKNAMEAISDDGNIWITLHKRNEHAEVIIEDDGCGMSNEQLKNVFKPFVTYKPTGTGLGLPIVASIIEQLNGSIQVKSKVGVGTKFIVMLPLDLL